MISVFNFPCTFIFTYLLLYLLLNSCDGNDMKDDVFSSVDCWWLWKSRLCRVVPSKRADFCVADAQSDVLSPSRMDVTAFCIDQQLRRWLFVICFPMCHCWCRDISSWETSRNHAPVLTAYRQTTSLRYFSQMDGSISQYYAASRSMPATVKLVVAWHSGSPSVFNTVMSLTGKLSLSRARPTADGWPMTIYVGKSSANQGNSAFHSFRSINE